ncbi:protein SENSITIVITY TO RED LIGHT REDUCED 1-like [Diospyros lotus]|uniref:protein SENSITIVITY TO RED LIGHT REDUCED 1-like n=1 Tax=Diospyros lotus TaxID=55363 RepID=UPI00225BA130|nr:protein SENSITIVITY TO RED LIGHT REDUCED 1-like [Diospyros lotus]XP_052192298.1 protein SENSITIVITY TO RED LIGHT REDUCED 1-like [Diospyros lotus]
MAASAKTHTREKPRTEGDWTIVLPRRGKQRMNLLKTRISEQEQSWVPTEHETNPDRELKLMRKIQVCMKKVESSKFFCTLMDQIQAPEIMHCILTVLGSESRMQVVIYGLGSIESYEPPQFQQAVAILMRKSFSWIGDVEVFDPILSATECRALERLGCSVLSINERGCRRALKPTLFFMPHCEVELYDNLVQANWKTGLLHRILLFGNSFKAYEEYGSVFKNSTLVDSGKHVLAVGRFTKEFGINTVSMT